MREEIKPLENHPDLHSLPGDIFLRILQQLSIFFNIPYHSSIYEKVPAFHFFEMVDRPKQGALAGAAGANDHQYLVF